MPGVKCVKLGAAAAERRELRCCIHRRSGNVGGVSNRDCIHRRSENVGGVSNPDL